MSQSATPATQNDMPTCLETSKKERFCSFHRYGEATGKPETRDETRGSIKTNISCEISANFHTWKPSKRRGFAASPIDTTKPQEHQRLETRHVGAESEHFVRDFLQFWHLCSLKIDVFPLTGFLRNLKICYLKIDVSCEASVIFNTSHKMPRLPRNLHLVATWRIPANAIRKKARNTTRLKCCACHEKWRWTRPKCCACHENCNASSENVARVLRLRHKTTFNTLQNTSECHELPRLPCETKQRDVWNLQKGPPAVEA